MLGSLSVVSCPLRVAPPGRERRARNSPGRKRSGCGKLRVIVIVWLKTGSSCGEAAETSALVDCLDAVLLDGDQLHRSPDALRSRPVHCHNPPRPSVSLKRRRLFAHRLLVPGRVRRHVAGGRHDHRRHRHSTGTHTRHDLVVRFEHAARPGEFCAVVQHFPYHAGNRGRIQLAGRQQNRGGMVSRPGARSGGRHFRQRLERGRISGSLLCSISGDPLWLALRLSNLRAAGIPLAHSLDQHLPPTRPPSQGQ